MNELAKLAEYSSKVKLEDLPEEVIRAARYCVLDSIGSALGAVREGEMPSLVSELLKYDSGDRCPAKIWGYPDVTGLQNAVLLNGCMAHALELDDVHAPSKSHVGAVVVTAAWTSAQALGKDGKKFLEAVVAGYEVMARVGMAMDVSSNRRRGWHTTGIIGTFGAAAAVARLMDLDAKTTLNALGMAGTQSSGLWAFLAEGSTCKKLHPARAAANGLDAVILAMGGMTGPEHILDAADGGLLRAVSDSLDMSRLTEGLGESYAILSMDKKPYPCCRTTHHAIDSAIALKKQGLCPEEIEKVLVETYDIGVLQCGSAPYPKSAVEAKFSIQYTSAAAFVRGSVGLDEFKKEVIEDPQIRRIAENTEVRAIPLFTERYPKRWGSRTTVTKKDGSEVSWQTDDMSGSVARPLTPEQETEKFMSLGSAAFGREKLEELCRDILMIETLDRLPDLGGPENDRYCSTRRKNMTRIQKGDKMPNFNVKLAFKDNYDTDELVKGAKHTIFWVLRYMGCTTCQLDILDIADNYQKFKDIDTQVFVVLQSPAETIEEQTANNRLPYDVICDPDQAIYKELDIRATATKEERQPKTEEGKARQAFKKSRVAEKGITHGKYEGNEQQLPAYFIVNPEGIVEKAHYAEHAVDMPFVDEMLEIMENL